MGLNVSNEPIAQRLDLDKDDAYQMTAQLRSGVIDLKPEPALEGVVECDEVHIVAENKGHLEAAIKTVPGTDDTLKRTRHAREGETSCSGYYPTRRPSYHQDVI
jgi:hypothetical protein